jgi:hypothetical protein
MTRTDLSVRTLTVPAEPRAYVTLRKPINGIPLIPNQVFRVESEVVDVIAFDFNAGTNSGDLTVVMQNGYAYRYANVPATTAYNFLSASSHGEFYNHYIKSNFRSTRVDPA